MTETIFNGTDYSDLGLVLENEAVYALIEGLRALAHHGPAPGRGEPLYGPLTDDETDDLCEKLNFCRDVVLIGE